MTLNILFAFPLVLLLSSVHGFHAGATRVRSHVWMAAAQESHSNAETTTSLSGLVSNMLSAHREMAKEINEAATVSPCEKDGMPQAGEDGIYRIISEEQYRYVKMKTREKCYVTLLCSDY